jgi:predicted RNA binding protein YcfA (HicA-like mRNA interferase family)
LLYFANNNVKGYFDMSKLPVISGAECIKALEKVGFVVNRQRGSHITLQLIEESRGTIAAFGKPV